MISLRADWALGPHSLCSELGPWLYGFDCWPLLFSGPSGMLSEPPQRPGGRGERICFVLGRFG